MAPLRLSQWRKVYLSRRGGREGRGRSQVAPLRLSQWRKVTTCRGEEERRKGGEGQEPGGSPETITVEEGTYL